MSDQSPETTAALLRRDFDELRRHVEEQDKLIESMRSERDKALKWGITVLGGMVVSMVVWIVNFAKDHLK